MNRIEANRLKIKYVKSTKMYFLLFTVSIKQDHNELTKNTLTHNAS